MVIISVSVLPLWFPVVLYINFGTWYYPPTFLAKLIEREYLYRCKHLKNDRSTQIKNRSKAGIVLSHHTYVAMPVNNAQGRKQSAF
jgi:hypothetical protein